LVCKRILDLSLAGLGLVVLLLPTAIVALVIRLTSPGPALFRQQRVGRRGRPFTMYKFRSMYVTEGDVVHRAAFQKFRAGMPLDATTAAPYKFHADPRITPIGRVLRRTSLDELPQLLNIVRGEMSLVGPRPPIPYELEMYEERHMRRLSVKPGLTGLWQVRGRSRVTFEEMVALDLEYIRTRSLVTDLKLLLATLPVILFQKGAG
jgi:lipopolysaccharide/colanic/teichoic acid biosynthesis glycosyltransferase